MINYNFNLGGEGVQVSALSQGDREIFVYNRFLARAKDIAKYYALRHDMTVEECTLFVASSLYNKMCDIRSKEIKRTGTHYNAVEYLSMIRTLSQLKIAYNRANNTQAGYYATSSECNVPDAVVSFEVVEGVKSYDFKGHKIHAKTTLYDRADNRLVGKMFDYVDICTMWDNRHARHEYKLSRALENLNSLTSVYEYTSDKHYLTMTQEERDRAQKALNKQLHADARKYNDLRTMTELTKNYGTPESNYFDSLDNLRLMRKLSAMREYKHYSDVVAIVNSDSVMTCDDRQTLTRFRKHYNIGNLSRDELKYLLSL